MKVVRQRLAVLLAVLMLVPSQPVMAANTPQPETRKEENANTGIGNGLETASYGNAGKAVAQLSYEGYEVATSGNSKKTAQEMVKYNTGSCVYSVVSREEFEEGLGDAAFEEDSSYTINIPEDNPFFPYEVQFTHDGKKENRWFMTPDDRVTVGGHDFYVSAYFDGTVVTQMSLEVAGETVVVYPEEKEFTDGVGIMPLSLLPLEEKQLTVDLSAFTPVELTMVSIDQIFTGETALNDTDKVVWTQLDGDDYTISAAGGTFDLSVGTYYHNRKTWEMIVGDDDQLASDNIRYIVTVNITESRNWLIPTVYKEDGEGTRTEMNVLDSSEYSDRREENRRLSVYVSANGMTYQDKGYVGLKVNPNVFGNPQYASLKVFEGRYQSLDSIDSAKEITDQIMANDISKTGGFNPRNGGNNAGWITAVTYDASGKAMGILPFKIQLNRMGNYVADYGLYADTDSGRRYIVDSYEYGDEEQEDSEYDTLILDYGYPANGEYYYILDYEQEGVSNLSAVTAAFEGTYTTIAEAVAAGASDIKGHLFGETENGGYKADYSQGKQFTIFVGADGSTDQEVYHKAIKTKEGTIDLSGSTAVMFTGLSDGSGGYVGCYIVDSDDDSYAEYSYPTIIVEKDTDLTKLAPIFSTMDGIKLYTAGRSTAEVSGKSVHDFSDGPVQYTASAENKENAKNYWLQVIKPQDGRKTLYINSLADEDADTREENGVVYSTREMFLDGRYDYVHDMLIINMGTEAITNLSAELVSDEVELDEYWRLNGTYRLDGCGALNTSAQYGELSNLAKLRFVPKSGTEDGREISGTLTIRSGDTILMVLTLIGTAGDPGITTADIPDGVKYVPYGTMIQNSNKYNWNKVSYSLMEGSLPGGMVLKPNGELYGVPTETGEFTFTVRMTNSYEKFGVSEKTFTFTVAENTDTNVDGSTDAGYDLTQRVQDFALSAAVNQTLVSQGIYGEFVYVFLDGEKLVEGADFDSESGSTRITIRSQTFKRHSAPGVHTIGVEFRTGEEKVLKRAAQNYYITDQGNNSGSSGSSSSGNGSSSSSSGGGSSRSSAITRDSKKGYVSSEKGIITGKGTGYSHWVSDENGWKMVYADGTVASGHVKEQEDGSKIEQVLWEKVNGSWYAFGADGYLKSGWIYDYQLKSWYLIAVENGMQSGWYHDQQDGHTYYLDAASGNMALGWKNINGKWYYFNEITPSPTWELDQNTGKWFYNVKSKNKPFGSMYQQEKTPDGYYVNDNGTWDGKEK